MAVDFKLIKILTLIRLIEVVVIIAFVTLTFKTVNITDYYAFFIFTAVMCILFGVSLTDLLTGLDLFVTMPLISTADKAFFMYLSVLRSVNYIPYFTGIIKCTGNICQKDDGTGYQLLKEQVAMAGTILGMVDCIIICIGIKSNDKIKIVMNKLIINLPLLNTN